MAVNKIYEDIAQRTGGDIYIGVVGPVRTGKSTFIKKFMESAVIPNIDDVYAVERARDELPQSGSGTIVMTAEPKMVPENAVTMSLSNCDISVRLIDCVGYVIPGATGINEDGNERMVTTPWFDHEITFTEAAEEGTRRVIRDHSTIGLVITTDGSICGIERDNYIEAEEQIVSELKSIEKPFVVLVNSTSPNSEHCMELCTELTQKYDVFCMPINCAELNDQDIEQVLHRILNEFPVVQYSIYLPEWIEALPYENELKKEILNQISNSSYCVTRLKDANGIADDLRELELFSNVKVCNMSMSTGEFGLNIELPSDLYYQTISETCGIEINDDATLISTLCDLAKTKEEYDKVADALRDVKDTGYGVVMPTSDDMTMKEPEIIQRGGKYCAVLRAQAPAIHMMKTSIEAEVTPTVGAENASNEMLGFLLQSIEGEKTQLWESNIFGRSMYEIAADGLAEKINQMPPEVAHKLSGAMQKMINQGSGRLFCFIL